MIPRFLNIENKQLQPFAEMWMGTHKGAPSQVYDNNSGNCALLDICGELPFLFKLIAIDKPLSIQAHPGKKQAEEGFAREEESGLSIDSPVRNYKDSNHKPEIICAITPIELMAGFCEPEKILKSFIELSSISAALKDLVDPLTDALKKDSLPVFFRALFNFSEFEKEYLCSCINDKETGNKNVISDEQWKLMKKFTSLYPGDSAVLSPLYLNYMTIQPGQAVFIPAGILHAYISGFGVELMTSSDNVLRGGLTPKHVDVGELMNILNFKPFSARIISPSSLKNWFYYDTPCEEYALAYMRADGEAFFSGNCPAICIITEGEMMTEGMSFKKGDSFFLAQRSEPCVFKGNFSLYAACSAGAVNRAKTN